MKEEERREVEQEEEEKEPEKKFITKGLSEGLSLLNTLLAHFEAMDQNIELFARIRQMTHVFCVYHKIYDCEKKQTIQTKLMMLMIKTTPATPADDINDPQPTTSGQ